MALNAVTALVLLFALASAQTTMKRCKNYYDAGQRKNGMYDLEIYPRVIWRLYCNGKHGLWSRPAPPSARPFEPSSRIAYSLLLGMTTGQPKEYIDLPKKGAGNWARYYQYQGTYISLDIRVFCSFS